MSDADSRLMQLTQEMQRRHEYKDHVSTMWGLQETMEGNQLFLVHLLVRHKASIKRKRARTVVNFIKSTFQRTVTVAQVKRARKEVMEQARLFELSRKMFDSIALTHSQNSQPSRQKTQKV